MDFNEIWTKEKNDKLRQFIKEKKSSEYIRNYFGDDLKHHPTGKYNYSVLKGYFTFTNEIKLSKKPFSYLPIPKDSIFYRGKTDYLLTFKDNDKEYVIMLLYVENFSKPSYEIIFTTKKQYDEYKKLMDNYELDEELEKKLVKIIENETGYNNIISILDKLLYSLEISKNKMIDLKDIPYSITETDNNKKNKYL